MSYCLPACLPSGAGAQHGIPLLLFLLPTFAAHPVLFASLGQSVGPWERGEQVRGQGAAPGRGRRVMANSRIKSKDWGEGGGVQSRGGPGSDGSGQVEAGDPWKRERPCAPSPPGCPHPGPWAWLQWGGNACSRGAAWLSWGHALRSALWASRINPSPVPLGRMWCPGGCSPILGSILYSPTWKGFPMEQAFGFGTKEQRPALPSPWLLGSTAHCCALMGVQRCWPWVGVTLPPFPSNEGSNWAGFVLGWSRKAE